MGEGTVAAALWDCFLHNSKGLLGLQIPQVLVNGGIAGEDVHLGARVSKEESTGIQRLFIKIGIPSLDSLRQLGVGIYIRYGIDGKNNVTPIPGRFVTLLLSLVATGADNAEHTGEQLGDIFNSYPFTGICSVVVIVVQHNRG